MLVYHFISGRWGIDDLRKRRLKLAIIDELNDPFELLGANIRNKRIRRCLQHTKRIMSACSGFLCFSKNWTSPAQWAHYADRHRGFCFQFEVTKGLKKINYRNERADFPVERFLAKDFNSHENDRLFFTKATCWEYEDERRLLVDFADCQKERGRYYVPFSDALSLRKIYVGASSRLSESRLRDAMGNLSSDVEVIKVRPAFGEFALTPDKRWPPDWIISRPSRLREGTFAELRASLTGYRS